MLLFSALALLGFACAAFRWSVMVCIAGAVSLACGVVLPLQGVSIWQALLTAAGCFVDVQLAYVLGGALLHVHLRRITAKKNLQA